MNSTKISIPTTGLRRKTDWISGVTSGNIPRGEQVTMWVLPQGAICEVGELEGVATLRNGHYNALGSSIAKLLLDAGVRGTILLSSSAALPQNISQWITWWLSLEEQDQRQHYSSLRVTLFNSVPSKTLPFQVDIITPITLAAYDVNSTVFVKSKSQSVSQFLVARECGEVFRLEPRRTMLAEIVDVTEFGVVVRTGDGFISLVERVHHALLSDCYYRGIRLEDLIGTSVVVHYTMFTSGNRLNNFKSTEITKSLSDIAVAVDIVDPPAGPAKTSSELFKPTSWGKSSGILTLRRCLSARLVYDEEASVITGRDADDDDRVLFRFTKGARLGQYVATFDANGTAEQWAFEPTLCPDTLNPDSFVENMEERLYFASGLSLRGLGLCYADRMAPVA